MSLNFQIYLTLLIIFTSCSSKKDIIYLQDINSKSKFSTEYFEYKVKADDILKIDVNFEMIEPSFKFSTNQNNDRLNNKDAFLYNGFQVNNIGTISFPQLGDLFVAGKSIIEIKKLISDELINKQILKNPIVDVKLLNSHFTVLGEVNLPGRYEFLKNNLNILEALGMAGDLTINGKRDDIKIIRNVDGYNEVITLNLTNSNFIKDSYQVISGDIIIINPNSNRVKNAGIIGNSGTLLSLLSFLLSSIIIINN